jgi:hypothetical protein
MLPREKKRKKRTKAKNSIEKTTKKQMQERNRESTQPRFSGGEKQLTIRYSLK